MGAILNHPFIKRGERPYIKDPPGSGQGKTVIWNPLAPDSSGFDRSGSGFKFFLIKIVKKGKERLTRSLTLLYLK